MRGHRNNCLREQRDAHAYPPSAQPELDCTCLSGPCHTCFVFGSAQLLTSRGAWNTPPTNEYSRITESLRIWKLLEHDHVEITSATGCDRASSRTRVGYSNPEHMQLQLLWPHDTPKRMLFARTIALSDDAALVEDGAPTLDDRESLRMRMRALHGFAS